jgi:hypothetical protein
MLIVKKTKGQSSKKLRFCSPSSLVGRRRLKKKKRWSCPLKRRRRTKRRVLPQTLSAKRKRTMMMMTLMRTMTMKKMKRIIQRSGLVGDFNREKERHKTMAA